MEVAIVAHRRAAYRGQLGVFAYYSWAFFRLFVSGSHRGISRVKSASRQEINY